MTPQVFYPLFMAAVAAFIWWRLYRSLRDGKASVRGGTYVRDAQPRLYWATTSMMLVAALLITAIALVFSYGVASGTFGQS